MPETPQTGDVTIGEVYRTALRIEQRLVGQDDRLQKVEKRQAVDLERFTVIDRDLGEHKRRLTSLERRHEPRSDDEDAPRRRTKAVTISLGSAGLGGLLVEIARRLLS